MKRVIRWCLTVIIAFVLFTSNTQAQPFTVSGTILNGSSNPLSGVLVTASEGASGSGVTDINGNYSIGGIPENTFDIVLTPSLIGYTFDPLTIKTDVFSADVPGLNFTGAITTYTLTYSAGPNGSLSGTLVQTVNHGTDGTAVTAVPTANYHFVNWSDGSTANPRTEVNVTRDTTVTANFAINTYTLTYTAGANGTISGVTPQTVNHGSDGTAVTAVPTANYHFVNWSDGSTANPRTEVNVTRDTTVTAN
ncbi:MAG: InlB B-repeat-containing protein, partial [Ignavibacteriae bacterium]|nr:InlB B-repeat-containing protein [Ignavibacteriota bacterium]